MALGEVRFEFNKAQSFTQFSKLPVRPAALPVRDARPGFPEQKLRHHDRGRIAPGAGPDRVPRADSEPGVFPAREIGEPQRTRVREREGVAPGTALRNPKG